MAVGSSGVIWLNTSETARRLGVTPRTLYRFIDDGTLPAYRFGRVIRLKESDVDQFVEQCRIAPGSMDTVYDTDEADTSVSEYTAR